jgi:hypothetical protein
MIAPRSGFNFYCSVALCLVQFSLIYFQLIPSCVVMSGDILNYRLFQEPVDFREIGYLL